MIPGFIYFLYVAIQFSQHFIWFFFFVWPCSVLRHHSWQCRGPYGMPRIKPSRESTKYLLYYNSRYTILFFQETLLKSNLFLFLFICRRGGGELRVLYMQDKCYQAVKHLISHFNTKLVVMMMMCYFYGARFLFF